MSFYRTTLAIAVVGAVAASTLADDAENESFTRAARDAAIPLESFDDLDALVNRVGDDVRLVLLGESTHGTHEFYTWRDALSRRLITDRGFDFIAVEGDWAAIAELDRYVRNLPEAKESAREVLLSFDRWPLWMWANEEIEELAEWLREHNRDLTPAERVGIFGIDVYGVARAVEKVPRLLREVDQDLASRAEAAYECFGGNADDVRSYMQRLARGNSCESLVNEVVAMLREARRASDDNAADELLFRAKQSAMAIKRAEQHYRFNLVGRAESWNARAEHFFYATQRLLEHFGEDSRGIVWAHNTHIGDARATPMRMQRMVNIGQMAREALGRDVVMLIGFSTYQGEAIAGRAWEAEPERLPLPVAAPGSFDARLNALGFQRFAIVLNDLDDMEELERPISMRAIGVTYQPEQERVANYVPSVILERFDAVIFLRETKPLTPLHRADADRENDD